MTIKQKEFMKELCDLLLKYNAEISWTYDECSDTFGLVDNHLVISMCGQQNDIEFYGMDIDQYNVFEMIKESE